MGTICKKCGMESDREEVCSWCNADLLVKRPAHQTKRASASPPNATGASPRPAQTPLPPVEETTTLAPGRPAWLIPAVAAGAAVAGILIALLIMGISASGPPPEPGSWGSFTAKENSFAAHYPEGWGEPSNSGSAGSYVMVEWRATPLCAVKLRGSSTWGAIGDGRRRIDAPVGRTAEGVVLGWITEYTDFADRRPGYEETEAAFAHNFGHVRSAMAEYEYRKRVGLLGVDMKGVRWGSHQGDYGYHVYAEAPAKHWDAFWPVAEKIVGSVQFGSGTVAR